MTKTDRSATISEADWQDKVVEVARHSGWVVSHFGAAQTEHGWVTPVRYDGKGFPDCLFINTARWLMLFIEFKTDKGYLSDEQLSWANWIEAIEEAAPDVVKYYLWRPAAESEIIEYLINGDT